MKVYIAGPNLYDQSKGDFHVHADGCKDIARMSKRDPSYRDGWQIDVSSVREVVEHVYSDFIFHNEKDSWESFVSDIHFFPCCDLPYDTLKIDLSTVENIGAADGACLFDEEFTVAVLDGALEEILDQTTLETASTEQLNSAKIAYLNGVLETFTAKVHDMVKELS